MFYIPSPKDYIPGHPVDLRTMGYEYVLGKPAICEIVKQAKCDNKDVESCNVEAKDVCVSVMETTCGIKDEMRCTNVTKQKCTTENMKSCTIMETQKCVEGPVMSNEEICGDVERLEL